MSSLSVIVPVFNEQDFLSESLDRLISTNIANQILICDDGSKDNSLEIAENYKKKHPNVVVLTKQNNEGKGSALHIAKEAITSEFVVIHDADLEYSPNDLLEMLKLAERNKNYLILGSRFIGSIIRKNIYKRTLYANKFMSAFFSFVHNIAVSDVATCYKMMSSENFLKLNLNEKGFAIEIEILAKFLKVGAGVKEVPISYEGRTYQEGKKITSKDGLRYLFTTIKYRIN